MSYEGYVVNVCENGHYECHDAHNNNPPVQCSHCNAPWKHHGAVDETNCLPYYLNFFLVEKTPPVLVDCHCTGKCRKVEKEPATYTFHRFTQNDKQNDDFVSGTGGLAHYISENGRFIVGQIQLHPEPLKNDFQANYEFFGVPKPQEVK